MIKLTTLDIAKFWMQVEIDESSKALVRKRKYIGKCWVWKGSLFLSGYGRFFHHQKAYRAHRIAYLIYYGCITDAVFICHKCDNPKCVNPLHLFEGTPKQNTEDMIEKGRLNRSRGEGKGISYRKDSKKWRARHMFKYKNILVGEFDTEEEARIALKKSKESLAVH